MEGQHPVEQLEPELTRDIERVQVAAVQLARHLRTRVPSGLSRAATSALAAVVKYGPLSVSELAAHEGVHVTSMSRTLSQLLAAGLVSRTQDGLDGRVAQVRATPAGRELFLAHRRANTEFLLQRLRGATPQDLELIRVGADALERILELVEDPISTRTPPGGRTGRGGARGDRPSGRPGD